MTIEEILHDPQHPLHALNVAYQAYCQASVETGQLEGGHASSETRVAHCKDALLRYYAQKKKVVDQGLYFVFITLPPPFFGYLDLLARWTEHEDHR